MLVLSGFAAGVLVIAPMEPVAGTAIPVGKDVFGALPRVLAAVGSGVGAVVIVGGAIYSAARFARDRSAPGHAPAGRRQHPDRARHSRAVERGSRAGRRRPRRGLHGDPGDRDHRDLLRFPPWLPRVVARPRYSRPAQGKISPRVVGFPQAGTGDGRSDEQRASPGGSSNGIRHAGAGGVSIGMTGVREASQPAPSPSALAAGYQYSSSLAQLPSVWFAPRQQLARTVARSPSDSSPHAHGYSQLALPRCRRSLSSPGRRWSTGPVLPWSLGNTITGGLWTRR